MVIPLRRPPICPSYPSYICGVSQPGIHLSTSISGGYANSSCAITESTGVPAFSSTPTTMKQFSAKAIDNSLFFVIKWKQKDFNATGKGIHLNIRTYKGDFSYAIFQRGQIYFRQKKLKEVIYCGSGNFRFIVEGTKNYNVTASITPEGELSGLSCDWPVRPRILQAPCRRAHIS